jgi:hypothetical protein
LAAFTAPESQHLHFRLQLWAAEAPGTNATALDDYRVFAEQGGLTFDGEEE